MKTVKLTDAEHVEVWASLVNHINEIKKLIVLGVDVPQQEIYLAIAENALNAIRDAS